MQEAPWGQKRGVHLAGGPRKARSLPERILVPVIRQLLHPVEGLGEGVIDGDRVDVDPKGLHVWHRWVKYGRGGVSQATC